MSEAPVPPPPQQDPTTPAVPQVRKASRGALVFGVIALAALFGLSTYYSTRPRTHQGATQPAPSSQSDAQRLITEIIEQQQAQNDQRRRRLEQDRAIEQALAEQLAAPYPPLPPPSDPRAEPLDTYPQDDPAFYESSGPPDGSQMPAGHQPSRMPPSPRETPREARNREAMEAPILARQAQAQGRSRGSYAAPDDLGLPPFPAELADLIRDVAGPPAPSPAPPAPPLPKSDEDSAPAAPLRLSPSARPGGPVLSAGSVIPAVLTRKINSDLAGVATAMVSQDVLDSHTASRVLIPRGSLLVGNHRSAVAYGQDRLEIAWTRLTLPDGRTFDLAGMPGADSAGATGVSDRVDRHLGRLYGSAILLSLISAGAQLSQPDSYSGSGALNRAPSAGEVASGALGQRLNDLSASIVERELNVRPTLTIRPGTPFLVSVTTDIVFPGN